MSSISKPRLRLFNHRWTTIIEFFLWIISSDIEIFFRGTNIVENFEKLFISIGLRFKFIIYKDFYFFLHNQLERRKILYEPPVFFNILLFYFRIILRMYIASI